MKRTINGHVIDIRNDYYGKKSKNGEYYAYEDSELIQSGDSVREIEEDLNEYFSDSR